LYPISCLLADELRIGKFLIVDAASCGGASDLQPRVWVLLAMTWTAGDSEWERFEAAGRFYMMSQP
jgi:hypothetical protein